MELLLTDAATGERLVQALPGLLLAGLIIAVARLLFQLLRDIQANEPFTRRNVRRIYAIGSIVGIGGVLVQYAQGLADNAIQLSGGLPEASDATLAFSLNPLPLVVMAVILLVGEALRRGVNCATTSRCWSECRSTNRTGSAATWTNCSKRAG